MNEGVERLIRFKGVEVLEPSYPTNFHNKNHLTRNTQIRDWVCAVREYWDLIDCGNN